ncbi:Transmembrane protein [Parasponia andersonii]|uniref:Transmembrane protein n=1 Tax=Parasponia andersonii TaxID=3476 RepID=A0A2P5B599_PARAD|nr:Transmembrane protein [Parasponia andersonii]
MASLSMPFFTFSLFLFSLIFTQGIPSIDGRPLMNLGKTNIKDTTKIVGPNYRDAQADRASKVAAPSLANATPPAPPSGQAVIGGSPPPPLGHDISDFRPTAPGHSPGVGHSIQN